MGYTLRYDLLAILKWKTFMRSATKRQPSAISASLTVTTFWTRSHKIGKVFCPTFKKHREILLYFIFKNVFLRLAERGMCVQTFARLKSQFWVQWRCTCWVFIPSAIVSKNCGGFSQLKIRKLSFKTKLQIRKLYPNNYLSKSRVRNSTFIFNVIKFR